jgi:chaperonin GroEL (HSP60 family)
LEVVVSGKIQAHPGDFNPEKLGFIQKIEQFRTKQCLYSLIQVAESQCLCPLLLLTPRQCLQREYVRVRLALLESIRVLVYTLEDKKLFVGAGGFEIFLAFLLRKAQVADNHLKIYFNGFASALLHVAACLGDTQNSVQLIQSQISDALDNHPVPYDLYPFLGWNGTGIVSSSRQEVMDCFRVKYTGL